ncbi:MAG TPA: 3'(2'),5'-bisphosphate nucleotidase [Chloroflexi bacterium]|nr:3'(2'),5'-bisphosphate nucleotidase [Chloroflexota bacterium]
MSYWREKEIAIQAVTRATVLCEAVQAEMTRVESLKKGDRSPVTIADFGVQALICRLLKDAFPQDPIVGEEDAQTLRDPTNAAMLAQVTGYVQRFFASATPASVCRWIDAGSGGAAKDAGSGGAVAERFWTLDPIDGTKGFLRNDQYAVALALIEHGETKVAVLGCPALPSRLGLEQAEGDRGVLFTAIREEGAEMASLGDEDFERIHVSQPNDRDRWRFVESVEASHGNPVLQEAVAQAVGFVSPPLKLDSQAKYGAVARGDAALYLRLPSPQTPGYREKIWDHAAGALIVEEAGGRVTDMHGKRLNLAAGHRMENNRGVVVSNGIVHTAVLQALKIAVE